VRGVSVCCEGSEKLSFLIPAIKPKMFARRRCSPYGAKWRPPFEEKRGLASFYEGRAKKQAGANLAQVVLARLIFIGLRRDT